MSRSSRSRTARPLVGVVLLVLPLVAVVSLRAQSTARRLQSNGLRYLGAFRLPPGEFGSEYGFSFGGSPMTYNPANHSLFIGGHPYESMIAEVSIPTPVISANLDDLPFARMLQPFADPTDGNRWNLSDDTVYLGGLLVHGGKLYGTVYIYYDADNTQRVSHYARSLNLSVPSATPLTSVGNPDGTGLVSGYLAAVPHEWQAALGGTAITGQCCIPIAYRTSWGPDAFTWTPESLALNDAPAPTTALQFYDADHATLGQWEGSNEIWGGSTRMGGVVLVPDTRTALFVGVNGTGSFCYGSGTDDRALDGTPTGDGDDYCYDPTNLDKGVHAYPYNYQFWAFDVNDWVAVARGQREPWSVMPYGVWRLDLPTEGDWNIGGVGYDAQSHLLYLSQMGVDEGDETYRPIVHVFRIQ